MSREDAMNRYWTEQAAVSASTRDAAQKERTRLLAAIREHLVERKAYLAKDETERKAELDGVLLYLDTLK